MRRYRLPAILVVAAAAAVVASVAASPSHAGARGARAGAAPCPGFAHVASYHGVVSASFTATASGSDPGNGGTQTIALDRKATNLKLTLGGKIVSRVPAYAGATFFLGKASGGAVSVGDTFANTGTGFKGSVHGGGPAVPGAAALALFPSTCRYQFGFSFGAHTSFGGDDAIHPGLSVHGSAYGPSRHIPPSSALKLAGSVQVGVYETCRVSLPYEPPPQDGCYVAGGGWTTDFATLFFCNSVVAANCKPEDEQEGTAHISWSLVPSFGK